jgi:RNA polymerase sigma-70 factor (ECF subfamily)
MDGVYAVTAWSPRARAGAEAPSFQAVAEQHLDDVHAYLVYLTGERGLAEDLTSETFERAFRKWRRFDHRRASAKTWLCQIARSTALDHFRAEQRRRRREQTYAVESRAVDDGELLEGLSPELEQAVRSLSRAEREVVALRVVLELDGDATARLLGISATACSTRLSRALRKIEEQVSVDVRA